MKQLLANNLTTKGRSSFTEITRRPRNCIVEASQASVTAVISSGKSYRCDILCGSFFGIAGSRLLRSLTRLQVTISQYKYHLRTKMLNDLSVKSGYPSHYGYTSASRTKFSILTNLVSSNRKNRLAQKSYNSIILGLQHIHEDATSYRNI